MRGRVLSLLAVGATAELARPVTSRAFMSATINATYSSNVDSSGWGYLSLEYFADPASMSLDDILSTHRAAGAAEGQLLCVELKQTYENFYYEQWGRGFPPAEIVNFMVENYQWVAAQAAALESLWLARSCGALKSATGTLSPGRLARK